MNSPEPAIAPTNTLTTSAARLRPIRPTLLQLCREEDGQDLFEYCLILSALGLSAFAVCSNIAVVVANGFTGIGNSITSHV